VTTNDQEQLEEFEESVRYVLGDDRGVRFVRFVLDLCWEPMTPQAENPTVLAQITGRQSVAAKLQTAMLDHQPDLYCNALKEWSRVRREGENP
jgi:hypothetical protein